MTFLEQSLGVFTSVSRSHISKLVQDKSEYTRAPPLHASCSLRSACVHPAVQYRCCVQCTVYSTAGFRQRVQSKADQQRVTGDLIHAQTMQPGHHHMTSLLAVVVITSLLCFQTIATVQTGGGAGAREHSGGGSRGRVCVMLGGAAL